MPISCIRMFRSIGVDINAPNSAGIHFTIVFLPSILEHVSACICKYLLVNALNSTSVSTVLNNIYMLNLSEATYHSLRRPSYSLHIMHLHLKKIYI